jgi:Mn-containing catalase
MFMHNKRLMYTVRVAEPNPRMANLILEQFGGADGELAAAMRYFTQALADCDPGRKDLLFDISTEEISPSRGRRQRRRDAEQECEVADGGRHRSR